MNKLSLPLLLILLFAVARISQAQEVLNCEDGQCPVAIAQVKYFNWDAWRLTDGKTEAIIVPAIGRVMSFKSVNGKNWLWSAVEKNGKANAWGAWQNWGGEKTWLSPQSSWDKFNGTDKKWPPPPQWEQMPFEAEVLSGGRLRLTGQIAPATGMRIIREFWHDESGEFLIRQTVEKLRGAPVAAGIWNVAQVDNAGVSAVFLPRAENSDYQGGFLGMSDASRIAPESVTSTVLQVAPTMQGAYKIGTDAARVAAGALRDDELFLMKSTYANGDYPDGAPGKHGTSVQLFGYGAEPLNYLELELMSPLRKYSTGARWTQTIRWSLQRMPSDDANGPAVHQAVDKLLG